MDHTKEMTTEFQAAIWGEADGINHELSDLTTLVGAQIMSGTEAGDADATGDVINQEYKILGGLVDHSKGVYNGGLFKGGKWILEDMSIQVKGGIGNDFIGLGSGILAEGDSELVLDGVKIHCEGAARTPIVAKDHAKILVKNAHLSARDGDLEADYVGTVAPDKMKSTPWMLGINGNARATNLMGNTVATYFNSTIEAEKWGALSTDDNISVALWAVNCSVAITGGKKSDEEIFKNASQGCFEFYDETFEHDFPEGEWQSTNKPSGYGTYSIGNTNVVIAGSTIIVPDYIAVVANGPAGLKLTTSNAIDMADTYKYLDIVHELKAKKTVAISQRFGVMYHSGAGFGVTTIEKGSIMYTGKTTFLVKGCGTIINVDASNIFSGNGVVLQVMDNDDAGINLENLETTTDYVENHAKAQATETSTNAGSHVEIGGVFSTFSNMTLNGDIYNASGWEESKAITELAGMGDYDNEVGGGASKVTDLSVVLDNVKYSGVISTSESFHHQPVISHIDYSQIGDVTNVVRTPENAAIVVELKNGTTWTVTGTGYITGLMVDETSSIGDAKVYVNGQETSIVPGEFYKGIIRIEGLGESIADIYQDPKQVLSGSDDI